MSSNLVSKVKVPILAPFHEQAHILQREFIKKYVIIPNAIYLGSRDWYDFVRSEYFRFVDPTIDIESAKLQYMGMELIQVQEPRHLSVGIVMRRLEIDDLEKEEA